MAATASAAVAVQQAAFVLRSPLPILGAQMRRAEVAALGVAAQGSPGDRGRPEESAESLKSRLKGVQRHLRRNRLRTQTEMRTQGVALGQPTIQLSSHVDGRMAELASLSEGQASGNSLESRLRSVQRHLQGRREDVGSGS